MSGDLECGTATVTLDESGVLSIVETTDETGAPDPYRFEGIWRTSGNQLTLELFREGVDAENLTPIDPPEMLSGTYTLSGDTLTFGGQQEGGDTIANIYERI